MKRLARALRKNMTDAEKHLWYHLRDRRLAAYKFRRQKPIGPFIADFVCFAEKLIIEIDGGQHAVNEDADRRRTACLNQKGYKIVRFWNNEVFGEKEAVLSRIMAAMQNRGPLTPTLSPGERGKTLRAADKNLVEKTLGPAGKNLVEKTLGAAEKNLVGKTLGATEKNPVGKARGAAEKSLVEKTLGAAGKSLGGKTLGTAEKSLVEKTRGAAEKSLVGKALGAQGKTFEAEGKDPGSEKGRNGLPPLPSKGEGRGEGSCRLRVGTSGYSYPEWSDAGFYPPGTPAREMLPLYARRFSITELNYTWYQMPKAAAMERMLPRVPAGFEFAAKLTRTLTHEIDPNGWRGQVTQFREGIAPLVQAERMAALLIQLPPSFERSDANRSYLAQLLDELAGLPAAVEFRHRSWAEDRVFAELQRRRVTLVTVDVPDLPYLFPALDVVTNPDLFYVRFHGRNARGWRSGNMQKQFDYLYSASELQAWSRNTIPKMAAQARSGILFFNNHVRAQAPRNAQMLMEDLGLFVDSAGGPSVIR